MPKHKPVAIIRRSRPLQYIQMDVFQLDERPLKTMVTYTNKKGQRVTVPLVNRYALIAVDVFSKYREDATDFPQLTTGQGHPSA